MISRQFWERIRVVGVTYNDRQAVIAKLGYSDQIVLKREMENRYDPNAIAVYTSDGQSIGYIPHHVARELSAMIDQGRDFEADINEIKGKDGPHIDVGINIYERKDGEVYLTDKARILIKELRKFEDTYGYCVFGVFLHPDKEGSRILVRYRNQQFKTIQFYYDFDLLSPKDFFGPLEELKNLSYLDFGVNMHFFIQLTELGRSIDVSEL